MYVSLHNLFSGRRLTEEREAAEVRSVTAMWSANALGALGSGGDIPGNNLL